MAQSGYTPILIYASGTASNVPLAANLTSSASGAELALNYADGKLYFKNSSGVVTLLAGSGGGGPAAGSNTQIQFNNSGVFGASANLTWSGTVLSTTGLTATGAITLNTTTNNQSYTTTGAGTITISSGTAGSINNMNIGATTAGTGTFTSLSDSGNLTFTGTGNRITGDFSNATLASRVAFQTSTTNGNSTPLLLPNGTATTAGLLAFNNSDPTNAAFAAVISLSTAMQVSSGIAGTGTYVPMTFYTSGSEKLRIAADTTGTITIGGTAPRITGDFSNATASNRVIFQTSTASANTRIGIMPNAASTGTAGPVLYSTNDPNNASVFDIRITDGVQASLQSTFNGTGTYLPMTFYTGGSERIRIVGGTGSDVGFVGIGTTTPQSILHIRKDASGSLGPTLLLQNASGGVDGSAARYATTIVSSGNYTVTSAIDSINRTANYDTDMAFSLYANTGGFQERMRITYAGNVGIGTSSPTVKLDITGNGNIVSKFQNYAASSGIDSYVAEGTSAAPTALLSGRQIMNYRSYGYDGASYIFVGGIDMQAESAFSVGTNPTYLRFRTSPSSGGGREVFRMDSVGNALVTGTGTGSLGYGTGSGGTVTQATSKSTAVTLNKPTGRITMASDAILVAGTAQFTFTNSLIAATDLLQIAIYSPSVGNPANYRIGFGINSGSATVFVTNQSAGSLSEGIQLNFVLIKGATS